MTYYLFIFILVLSGFAIVLWIFYTLIPDFSIINNTAFAQYNTTQLRNMGFFDNERYLISALVQSLAATIALVITLSLVAVQLAAQSYSARVIDVYKNNPDMWILLSIYIAVIFYGLGLLKVIDIGVAGINMEFAIFAAYFLGFFAFVCLVPYMLKTLDLLKPSNVIELLAEEITKEKVFKSTNHTDDGRTEKDPIQPITDIVNSGLLRNDYETVRNGLAAIKNATFLIFETTDIEKDEKELSSHILLHVERLGILAANRETEDSAQSVIWNLGEIGTKAAEQRLEKATQQATIALLNVGTKAVEQKLELATRQAAIALGNVGTKAAEQNLELAAQQAAIALGNVGTKAVEQKLELAAQQAAIALENVGTKAVEQKLELAAKQAVIALGNVGTKAVEQNLELAAQQAAIALGNVGTKKVIQKFKLAEPRIAYELGILGKKAAEQKLEMTVWLAAIALGNVGTNAAEQKIETAINLAKKGLTVILKIVEENGWNDIAQTITDELEKIKQILDKPNNKEKD